MKHMRWGLTVLGLAGGSLVVVTLTWPVLVAPTVGPAAPGLARLPVALAALCAATLLVTWAWWVLSVLVCLVEEVRHRAGAAPRRRPGHGWAALRPPAARGLARVLVGGGLTCLLAPLPGVATAGTTPDVTATDLPLPVRPLGGPPRAQRSDARDGTVLVRPGDTLWSLAALRLGPRASDSDVDAAWRRLYRANRPRIGDDPDLIHPGTRLRLP